MGIRVLLALVGLSLGAPASVGAIDDQINDSVIAQAIAVGRQLDPVRTAFHARYTVALADPTFERVEVITEYRRVVMMAEEQLKIDTLWDVAKAKPGLRPYRGLVSFVLLVKFSPQNFLPQPQLGPLPNYELILYPKGIPPPPAKPEILRLTALSETMLFPAGSGSVAIGPTEPGPRPPVVNPQFANPLVVKPTDCPPPPAGGPAGAPSLRFGCGSSVSGVRIEGTVPLSALDLHGRLIVGLLLDGKEQRQLVFNLASLR